MYFIKKFILISLCIVLVACGHGFEGEYSMESSNKVLNSAIEMAGASTKLIIGSDFMESQGQRTEFDDIFVRESDQVKYLVFKSNKGEQALKIIDNETLVLGNSFAAVTYKKIN